MINSDATGMLSAPPRKKRGMSQEKYAPYFFISPFYILFAIFFLFPTIFALVLGFYKWGALGEPRFFELRNYEHMFKDPLFIKAFWNTIFYAGASLFVVMPLALLEAMALNAKRLRFKYLWRTLYFAPIVTSAVAISLVFRLLYNTNYGFINQIILLLGGVTDPVDGIAELDENRRDGRGHLALDRAAGDLLSGRVAIDSAGNSTRRPQSMARPAVSASPTLPCRCCAR